jgi:hypothetical protein
MIRKLWLAALFGILFGLGMTYATFVPVAPATVMQLPPETFEANRQTTSTSASAARPHSDSALLPLSILAGIIVATPAFLLAKKYS